MNNLKGYAYTFLVAFLVVFSVLVIIASVAVPTVEEYNETFEDPYAEFDAMEYMFGVPSEQYVEVDTSVAPAERELGEGLVEETFTYTEFVMQLIMRILKFGL